MESAGVSQSVRETGRDESQSVPSPGNLFKTRDLELPIFEGSLPTCSPHSAGYTRTSVHLAKNLAPYRIGKRPHKQNREKIHQKYRKSFFFNSIFDVFLGYFRVAMFSYPVGGQVFLNVHPYFPVATKRVERTNAVATDKCVDVSVMD